MNNPASTRNRATIALMCALESPRSPLKNIDTADSLPMILPICVCEMPLTFMIARNASCGERSTPFGV